MVGVPALSGGGGARAGAGDAGLRAVTHGRRRRGAGRVPRRPRSIPEAIEDEVQRQIAARRKEMQKALEAPKPATDAVVAPVPVATKKPEEAAPPAAAPAKEAAPEPVPVSTEPPPPEPTAAPQPIARLPFRLARSRATRSRGELVGPGAGVVEPELVSTPHVTYPPIARQQRVSGKVVVLVLVDEEGQVGEVRLQQGIPFEGSVNEAVLQAVGPRNSGRHEERSSRQDVANRRRRGQALRTLGSG